MRDFTFMLIFIVFSPAIQAQQDDPLTQTSFLLMNEKDQLDKALSKVRNGIPKPIYVFNNTLSGHDHGLAGGGSLIEVNNIIINSATLGVKNTAGNSLITHCLFYDNEQDFINSNLDGVTNIFSDPLIDIDLSSTAGSPCIDGGISFIMVGSDTLLNMPAGSYYGSAPGIGAIESKLMNSFIHQKTNNKKIVKI